MSCRGAWVFPRRTSRPRLAFLLDFPYGIRITEEKLAIVDRGEEALREMGFRVFRVRHHDDTVRLEFGPEDLNRALDFEIAKKLTSVFKRLGYKYVTLDLEGYRSGSLNEVLVRVLNRPPASTASPDRQAATGCHGETLRVLRPSAVFYPGCVRRGVCGSAVGCGGVQGSRAQPARNGGYRPRCGRVAPALRY